VTFKISSSTKVLKTRAALAEKVRFLSDPFALGQTGTMVEVIESRMSYVFLVGDRAYKFKKPLRRPLQDFSTLKARLANCQAEVALNRRLAPEVYLGVEPLTRTPTGGLELGGTGRPVEWLVVMRRLPRDLMLDRILAAGKLTQDRIERLSLRLASFFVATSTRSDQGAAYRTRLRAEQQENRRVLTRRRFTFAHARLPAVIDRMESALSRNGDLLEARAKKGRLIDGHGDLRPEHICFSDGLDIIDCLEFNAELRLTDPVEEIAYLGMECEFLGTPELGLALFARIMAVTGDHAREGLFHLHFARKGLLRARLMLAHLVDPSPRLPEKWEPLAARYLALTEKGLDRLDAQEDAALRPVR
jgi:aminoglycoside phosphotransferase family enzyme